MQAVVRGTPTLRTLAMRCSDFRKLYSEFRDSRLGDVVARRRMERHLETCDACAHYRSALERGLAAIQGVREIEPPPGFSGRILRRVQANREIPEPVVPAPPALAAAAMVAAVVAIFVFEDGASARDPATQPVPTAERLLPQAIARPSIPLVSFTEIQTEILESSVQEPDESEEPRSEDDKDAP